MDLGIRGRKAIVCASSRGLGRGCAAALVEAGCDVVINGRDPAVLDATAVALRERFDATVSAVAGDIADVSVRDAILAACPDPDILVNNNGGPPFRDFRELDREGMLAGLTGNMLVPIEFIQRVAGGMADRGFGRIVNITSLSVYQAIPGLDLSSGARAGLTAFVAGVARTFAPGNVTINNILPGVFDTDRNQSTLSFVASGSGLAIAEQADRQAAAIPAGRIGTASEFGQTCAFLCSIHAGYITGRNIIMDGGQYPGTF